MVRPGIYTHIKGGQYEVLYNAVDATSGREGRRVVIYKSLDTRTNEIFVRDEAEFDHYMPDPNCKVHWDRYQGNADCTCLYRFKFLREA